MPRHSRGKEKGMGNEEMEKLVKMLDELGYQLVSINTLTAVGDEFGNRVDVGNIAIVISPAEKASR